MHFDIGHHPYISKAGLNAESDKSAVVALDSLIDQVGWVDPKLSESRKYLWLQRQASLQIAGSVLGALQRITLFLNKAAQGIEDGSVTARLDNRPCATKVRRVERNDIRIYIDFTGHHDHVEADKIHLLEIDLGADGTPDEIFGSRMFRRMRFAAQIRKVGIKLTKSFDEISQSEPQGLAWDIEPEPDGAAALELDVNPEGPRAMVFTLGQGGYDRAFARAVRSQRDYCVRHGYAFACIAGQGDPALGRENIWLKVLALYGAMLKNDYVLYLDTDVEISTDTPPFTEVVTEQDPIGLVAGHSGRVNAGVILVRSNARTRAFFREWIASLGVPLAARHDVGWGENGHLIRLASEHRLRLLPTEWNNTFRPELADYLRHYTGPMREHYQFDTTEWSAWRRITEAVAPSKKLAAVDPITSLARLSKVYSRTVPKQGFAPFDGGWAQVPRWSARATVPGFGQDFGSLRAVHYAEPISNDSANAYVLTLRDGMRRILGEAAVTSGVERFWTGVFQPGEILHIEWLESLFGWKMPDEAQVALFEARMEAIAQHTPILYTAHNFDLMPTYGEIRPRLLEAVARHVTTICHLSAANIGPYNRHHIAIPGLDTLPTAVVPHGDYQPYFAPGGAAFDDPALRTDKRKILVFGHIRTQAELDFCLAVAERLGDDGYQMIIAGAVHHDILHWKEARALIDGWEGGVRRLHVKVPAEQVRSLVSRCDGVLVPRFERLNSGVQLLAYSMLKPAFVPTQNSMLEIGAELGGAELYQSHDPVSAVAAIHRVFDRGFADEMAALYRRNAYNYRCQDSLEVGRAHFRAYERALSTHAQRRAG